jgi:hypothetical protein
VLWERHSSSRRWARQRSTPWMHGSRLPGRSRHAPRGRPPPPPPTRTADGSPVSHPRAGAARSAHARRSAARRSIARPPRGPDRRTAPGLGGPGAPHGLAPSPGRRTSSPLGPPLTGRPECRVGMPRTTTSRPSGRLVRRNRRRPTLPGPCEPSTIGAVGLNCSVRNGKRCFPHAIATGNLRDRAVPQNCTALPTNGISIRQALDPLVPVSCVCHHTSRSGLSTWWSTRGLTPSRGWESSSRGRLPA